MKPIHIILAAFVLALALAAVFAKISLRKEPRELDERLYKKWGDPRNDRPESAAEPGRLISTRNRAASWVDEFALKNALEPSIRAALQKVVMQFLDQFWVTVQTPPASPLEERGRLYEDADRKFREALPAEKRAGFTGLPRSWGLEMEGRMESPEAPK